MLGTKSKKGSTQLQLNGQMTLEAMNLDRKEEFKGDTFDPFKMGGNNYRNDMQLKESHKYMGVSSTVG